MVFILNPSSEMETLCLAHFYQQRLLQQKAHGSHYQQDLDILLGPAEKHDDCLRQYLSPTEIESRKKELNRLHHSGVQFCFPGHSNYPRQFLRMSYPPFLLSYIGHPVWRERTGLAVVGSREASEYSLRWMEQNLSFWLKANPAYIVSGGARGVDQKAHLLCLQNQRPTVAVLPSGLGVVYPPSLQSWISKIVEAGGALVSEYDFDQPMRKHFFQARNRLISALGACSLVVQAERRSGTMITARQTVEQGKVVLVVPSHPLDVSHQGGLDLICEGASPVRDAQDLQLFFAAESTATEVFLQSLVRTESALH